MNHIAPLGAMWRLKNYFFQPNCDTFTIRHIEPYLTTKYVAPHWTTFSHFEPSGDIMTNECAPQYCTLQLWYYFLKLYLDFVTFLEKVNKSIIFSIFFKKISINSYSGRFSTIWMVSGNFLKVRNSFHRFCQKLELVLVRWLSDISNPCNWSQVNLILNIHW